MNANNLFITIFSSMALIGYLACFIPQIVENYRLKSTRGLSDSFLLMYFFGVISILYYIFCLNLPFPYKCIVPLEGLLVFIIIVQRFYYDRWSRIFFYSLQILNLFFLLMLPYAFKYPTFIGNISGWISFVLFTLYSIPQTVKIFKEKSVKGFSIGYLNVFTFATLCEFIVSCTGVLPIQTVATVIKNLLTSLIFYIQFWLYKE